MRADARETRREQMNSWIIALVTSNMAIAAIVGVIVAWLVKWAKTDAGTRYAAWWGLALQAVKAAEKAIPDDTANKGLAKLDFACKQFVSKYEAATKTVIPEDDGAEIENLIEQAVQAVKGGTAASPAQVSNASAK
jgi:hypothetical protein